MRKNLQYLPLRHLLGTIKPLLNLGSLSLVTYYMDQSLQVNSKPYDLRRSENWIVHNSKKMICPNSNAFDWFPRRSAKKVGLSCHTLLAGPHSTQLSNKSEMNRQLGMSFTHCKLLWVIHIRTPSHTCTLSLGPYETGASTKQRK